MVIIYHNDLTATINGELQDVTPKKCSFTNEPITSGYIVAGYYVADTSIAKQMLVDQLQQDGLNYESWDEVAAEYDDDSDWFYFTDWYEVEDLFYDEQGNEYKFNDDSDTWERA